LGRLVAASVGYGTPTDATAQNAWPSDVVADLNGRYFREAGEQLGVDESNDFIFGPLQNALRQQLFEALRAHAITDAIPLSSLPDHPAIRERQAPVTAQELLTLLGLTAPQAKSLHDAELLDLLKLEAPLAVQRQTLSGLLPFNKFSSVPLLMQASRSAQSEARNDDVKKRLMIVPNCHAKRLVTAHTQGGLNVVSIETNQGFGRQAPSLSLRARSNPRVWYLKPCRTSRPPVRPGRTFSRIYARILRFASRARR
jgi:hypothetical protein